MKLSERAQQHVKVSTTPAAPRRREAAEPLACPHCGCLVDDTPDDGSPYARNIAHLRAFFAEVAAVTASWRNFALFDPAGNRDVMRGWLLIEAGHCDISDIRLPIAQATNPEALASFMTAAMEASKRTKRYSRISERAGFFCLLTARSIATKNLGEIEFRALHARIHDVLEREGFDVDALQREGRAASIRNKEARHARKAA